MGLRCTRFLTSIFLFLLLAVASQAQPAWQWGSTGTHISEAWIVAADNAGNTYAVANNFSDSTAVFGSMSIPTTGAGQIVWVKYSPSGAPLWVGGSVGGTGDVLAATCDPQGNLLIMGSFTDTLKIGSYTLVDTAFPFIGPRYFVAKLSPAGAVLWALRDGSLYATCGITTDDSGNVYICGDYNKATMQVGAVTLTNANPGATTDFYVVRYSPDGVLQWVRSGGGPANDVAYGITIAAGGDVYISGQFAPSSFIFGPSVVTNSSAYAEAFIAKFGADGTPLWAQAGVGGGSQGLGLGHDGSGNVYLCGNLWNGSLSFGSATLALPGAAGPSVSFLAKFTPADTVAWERTIFSVGHSSVAAALAVSPCGKVWVCGGSTGQLVFAPGDTLALPTVYDPLFIANYDFSGTLLSHGSLASGGDDDMGIAADGLGNAYVCADVWTTSLAIGPDVITPAWGEQIFVARYGPMPDTLAGAAHTGYQCGTDSLYALQPPPLLAYQWDDGETTQVRRVGAPGDYLVYGAVCGDTVTADTFHVLPHAAVGSIAVPAVICVGATYTLADTTTGGTWQSSAPTIASIDAVGVIHAISTGTFVITYTTSVCAATQLDSVVLCEGVHSVTQNNDIRITPNPAHNTLTIQTSAAYTSCTIISNIGQALITQPITITTTEVNVSSLPPGTYYIRLTHRPRRHPRGAVW